MNRETKRMLQRQGEIGPDGEPARPKGKQQSRPAPRQARERTGPATYVKEVRGELRKVAWPTRPEVINYSIIVFITVVLLTSLIFVLDFGFARAVLYLFDT